MTPALVAVLAVLPLCVGVVAARRAGDLARRGSPKAATVLLTGLALTVALTTGLLLFLVAYLGTVSILPALHPDDWSVPVVRRGLPVPPPVAAAAGLVAVTLLGRAVVHLVRVLRSARRSAAAAGKLPGTDDLAIIPDDAVHAYAVPGRHPRVVVSTGLLRRLSARQRRALLAHERSHLRHRHHLYAQLARLAARANPLLRPVAAAVDAAIERWADADAVREVGDPVVLAHALGVAALAAPSPEALNAAGTDVVQRVADLLEPPRPTGGTAPVLAILVCWASATLVAAYGYGVVELSETVFHRGH